MSPRRVRDKLHMGAKLIGVLALALCAAAPAQAQIAFRAAGAQVAGTGASITPVIPAGTQAGDVAVLIVAGRPTNTTQPTAPAGWTLRSSSLREVGANDLKIMTFYRVLTGGDANPSVSLPSAWQGTAAGASGQIAVWSGVHTTTPFDAADTTGNATTATTWTPTTITTVTPGAWVVSAVATSDDNALTIMTAQGFTGRMTGTGYDTTTGGDHAVGLADKVQATPGAATLLTWRQSVNASDRWAGITFALRPVPANLPPTVSITSPANNATFTAPATITLTANAVDTDGTITKVEFFHGGTNLIATVTAAPYTFNWTNVAAASYTLTAVATDNQNGTITSAPVNVTVNTAVAQMYYIHTDHLNTPRMISDGTNQVVWRWDHTEPFGADMANGNPSGLGAFEFNLRLPGQYFDKETNLHYNYFRDYDPAIGRYVQSDPIGLQGGINTYLYAGANPTSRVDPRGLAGISLSGGVSGFVATLGGTASGGVVVGNAGGTPNMCFQSVQCTRFGLGLAFLASIQVGYTAGQLCTGQTAAAGLFAQGAFGAGLGGTGSIRIGEGGAPSLNSANIGPTMGWGGAIGGEACIVTLICVNDPPCCKQPGGCKDPCPTSLRQMSDVIAP